VRCRSPSGSGDECLTIIVAEGGQPVEGCQKRGLAALGWNDGSFAVTTSATISLNIRTKDNRPHHHRLERREVEAFLWGWQQQGGSCCTKRFKKGESRDSSGLA